MSNPGYAEQGQKLCVRALGQKAEVLDADERHGEHGKRIEY